LLRLTKTPYYLRLKRYIHHDEGGRIFIRSAFYLYLTQLLDKEYEYSDYLLKVIPPSFYETFPWLVDGFRGSCLLASILVWFP